MRLLLTDADNTLWDTNSVYASAQLRLLENVEAHMGRSITFEDRLAFVRTIDQSLAVEHPKGLRYPPHLLSAAMMEIGFGGKTVAEAVRAVLAGSARSEVAQRFASDLLDYVSGCIPDLRSGVRKGLSDLSSDDVRITVLTEGDETRCVALLEHHQISRYVSNLKSVRKTQAVYRELKTLSRGPVYMVGDQLDVDVRLAKAEGLTAIYFPSEFAPDWTLGMENEADFTIDNYADVPRLLGSESRA